MWRPSGLDPGTSPCFKKNIGFSGHFKSTTKSAYYHHLKLFKD